MPETSRERVTRKYRRNLHMHFVCIANFLVVYFTSVFLNVRSSNVLIHATVSVIKETKIFSKDMAETAKSSASSLPRMKRFYFSRNCIHLVEVFPELSLSKIQFDFQGLFAASLPSFRIYSHMIRRYLGERDAEVTAAQ